jgi:hypothetical protein
MKSAALIVFASLILVALPTSAQKEEIPKSPSESVDPEKFSIEAINRILHGTKKRAARSSS